MPRSRRKKSWPLAIVEYAGVAAGVCAIRMVPRPAAQLLARRTGDLFYLLFSKRRRIALANVRTAFPEMEDEREAKQIVRRSCQSAFLTFLEMLQAGQVFPSESSPESLERICPGFSQQAAALQRLYQETGGFIGVTLHLGNWESLAHFASAAGLRVAVVARPLDNPLLHKMIYGMRLASGQEFVAHRNVAYRLKVALEEGKCVAVLADQRAKQTGLLVPFFGRPARTHRTPAVLACQTNRPIVVVASCRTETGFEFMASEPLWPDPTAPPREEAFRLTAAINEIMAEFIRKHPDQYLWVHDRWKNA